MAEKPDQNTLYVLWATDDPVMNNNMVFMLGMSQMRRKHHGD